jgi:predicted lipoprotein with Yx(FWY)xxD motif
MKTLLLGISAPAAAALLALGIGTSPAANRVASGGTTVATARTALGRVLVNGSGRTLYLFAKDKHGRSACIGQCAGFWPPLIASGKPLAAAGAKASLLGTTKRPDGRLQVTYNHHPLYTFVKDTRNGETNGEGITAFGAEWYAVAPAGAALEQERDTGAGAGDQAPAPTSGGYSY